MNLRLGHLGRELTHPINTDLAENPISGPKKRVAPGASARSHSSSILLQLCCAMVISIFMEIVEHHDAAHLRWIHQTFVPLDPTLVWIQGASRSCSKCTDNTSGKPFIVKQLSHGRQLFPCLTKSRKDRSRVIAWLQYLEACPKRIISKETTRKKKKKRKKEKRGGLECGKSLWHNLPIWIVLYLNSQMVQTTTSDLSGITVWP